MARYPYRDLGITLDRDFRNNLNANFDDIEADLRDIQSNLDAKESRLAQIENDSIERDNDLDARIDNLILSAGDSSPEVVDARYDSRTNTTYTTLKDRLDSHSNEIGILSDKIVILSEDLVNMKISSTNLVKNADFEELPFIQSRSSVYTFLAGVTSPQYNGKKSLKIEATGYETSSDPNKDFAILLTETMLPTDKLKISFWAYPSASNKTITVRMAFSSGVNVNLGQAGQWNKVEVVLDLSTMTQANNYLYFDLKSSFTLYMSDLRVEYVTNTEDIASDSFNKVEQKLNEIPTTIRNSVGIIERLIETAQTYLDNVNQLVYGNSYTAYDTTVQQVNGKYQIDCSSFANLMIHGVRFENSRYNGNTENIGSSFFFHNINSYKYRYANQIAKYAFEKGYAFKPNSDFSNVEPGDLLFFSWNSWNGSGDLAEDMRNNAFMKIDHVAVFLHKKNESYWTTLQFDNGISTVYLDVNSTYMSQCVLAARFPFANIESMYLDTNLLLDGDNPISTTSSIIIGSYKLSKPLQKGRYYTLVMDGQIQTENCYFVILVNGQTIYSDYGKQGNYKSPIVFRFPYLLDDVADTITIAIGAPAGTPSSRSGNVNWACLYEGYKRGKKYFNPPIISSKIKTFPLDTALVSDLNGSMAPYYKYAIDGNKIFINFSLPFQTLRTGNLVIGNMGSDAPKNTQRIPVNLIGSNNEAINAILQFSYDGTVTIIPYIGTVQWRYALAHGCIFKE